MNETLQNEVLDRLKRQIELPDKVSELVLAALMNEVEECLGGPASQGNPRPRHRLTHSAIGSARLRLMVC